MCDGGWDLAVVRKVLLGMIGLGGLACAAPSRAEDGCGTYPPAVREKALFSGWSDCDLRDLGHLPLWRDLSAEAGQVMRFVFTEGHGAFFRAITITARPNGDADLRVSGADRVRQGGRTPLRHRNVHLSAETMARISALAAQAGVWDFEVGSWDGEEIYLHCQLLEMEQASATSYRYSSVNIGCNHPAKLMPLVDEVARLAGLSRVGGGKLYR
jgi:hypothetical protein